MTICAHTHTLLSMCARKRVCRYARVQIRACVCGGGGVQAHNYVHKLYSQS